MIISVNKNFLWPTCILPCANCKTNTVHALSKTGNYYACSCGETVEIELEDENDN